MSAQSNLQAPQALQPPRRSWQWGAFIAAVLSSIVCLGLLTLLLLPPLQAAWATEIANGSENFSVADGVVVTPGEGWSVRPGLQAQPAWPVQPGAAEGLVLRSPDRVLTVTIAAVGDEAAYAQAANGATTWVVDTLAALEAARAGGSLRTETLANGVEVRHITSGSMITAVLDLPTGAVLVVGEVQRDATLDDYRAAFAELLLDINPGR